MCIFEYCLDIFWTLMGYNSIYIVQLFVQQYTSSFNSTRWSITATHILVRQMCCRDHAMLLMLFNLFQDSLTLFVLMLYCSVSFYVSQFSPNASSLANIVTSPCISVSYRVLFPWPSLKLPLLDEISRILYRNKMFANKAHLHVIFIRSSVDSISVDD